jgi:hypothetical protein
MENESILKELRLLRHTILSGLSLLVTIAIQIRDEQTGTPYDWTRRLRSAARLIEQAGESIDALASSPETSPGEQRKVSRV